MVKLVTYVLNRYNKLKYYVGADILKNYLIENGIKTSADNIQMNLYKESGGNYMDKIKSNKNFSPVLPEIYQLESIIQLIKNYKNNENDLLKGIDKWYIENEMEDNRKIVEYAKSLEFEDGDIFGQQVLYLFVFHAILLLLQIKKDNPNKKITQVLGGYHVTMSEVFRNFIFQFDFVDYLVIDDGRRPLLDIVNGKAKDKILTGSFTEEPYELPKYSRIERLVRKKQEVQLLTSVGCPNNCKFCASDRKHSMLDLDYIKNYIIDQNKLLPLEHITFVDDLINPTPSRFNELCEMIIDLRNNYNIKLNWSAHAHPKDFDDKTFDLLKESHCHSLFLGTETFDDDMLNLVNKKTTVKKNINTIKQLNRRGIYTKIGIIVNLPFENKERFMRSVGFLESLENEYLVIIPTKFKLYPGSDMYKYKEEYEIELSYWDQDIVDELDEIKGCKIPKMYNYKTKPDISDEEKYQFMIDHFNVSAETEK